jgi:DNA-binding CsgD family transcriptional regulator
VIKHTCGSVIPPDIEAYVRHLASCPDSGREIAAWCHAIVRSVAHEKAHGETAETPTETRDLTPAEMHDLRYAGKSLRDIAAIAGVAPETVRRRIAKWKREGGS